MIGRRRRRPIDLPALIDHHLEAGEPTGWFEPLYDAAGRDPDLVPWARPGAHPYVTDWLDDPIAAPPGTRAVVVGCGLGDDAAVLARRGYAVTAFDVAPSAIAWARRRHRRHDVTWVVADLLALPVELAGSFDLVVEVATVTSLPGVVRDAAMHAIGNLASSGGVVLTVGLLATSSDAAAAVTGPPWPQAPSELAAYRAAGLERIALEHPEAGDDGVLEVRATWRRTGGSVLLG